MGPVANAQISVPTPTGPPSSQPVSVARLNNPMLTAPIGVDPDTAVRDACRIEHDLSIESFEKIKEHVLKMKELRK